MRAGSDVVWHYVVRNTGNVPVTDVTVTDDQLAVERIDCGVGTNRVAILEPAEEITCEAWGVVAPGPYDNTGTATATAPATRDSDGDEVSGVDVKEEDVAHFFGAAPALRVVKRIDGQDAGEAPGVELRGGETVSVTIEVTNTGNVPLTDIRVHDSAIPDDLIRCESGEGNVIPILDVAASTSCQAPLAVPDRGGTVWHHHNTATASGHGPETTSTEGNPEAIVPTEDSAEAYAYVPAADPIPPAPRSVTPPLTITGVPADFTILGAAGLLILVGLLLMGRREEHRER